MFFTGNWEMLSGMLDTVGHSQAPKVLTSHLTQKKLVYKNITLTYFREESGYFWLRYMVGWEDHLYTILTQVCGPKQLQGCLPWRGKMLANTLEVTFHISVDKESHLRGTTVQKARS